MVCPTLLLWAALWPATAVVAAIKPAIEPNFYFSLDVNAMSPLISYTTGGETEDKKSNALLYNGKATAWWNMTFDGRGGEPFEIGESRPQRKGTLPRNGTSLGITSRLLANHVLVAGTVQGLGPGVTLNTSLSRPAAEMKTANSSNPSGLIAQFTSTDYCSQQYSVSLNMSQQEQNRSQDAALFVDSVTVVVGIQTQATSPETLKKRVEPFIRDGQPSPFYGYREGNFSESKELAGMLMGVPLPAANVVGAVPSSPEIGFQVPDNTSLIVLMGGTHQNASSTSIVIWPPGPLDTCFGEFAEDPGATTTQVSLNNGLWTARNATYYYNVLDPTVRYNISVSAPHVVQKWPWEGPGPLRQNYLFLESFTFYSGLNNAEVTGGGPLDPVDDVRNAAPGGYTPSLAVWVFALGAALALGHVELPVGDGWK